MNYFSFHTTLAMLVFRKLTLTYDFNDQERKGLDGILRLSEGQLIDLASGVGRYPEALNGFLSSNFDTTDVSRPHAYMVWMLYDNNMQLLPHGSGAKRVTDPNELKTLLEEDIPIVENGYLHTYVSNGSAKGISFDNFLVKYARGKTRQINHYYPYGLTIAGIDGDYDDYLNKYTSKELQTGEFDAGVSTGLEMLDFGSRFYDPQIGRWHTPDPAEQFANPYLAMGNNPVMYVDPDGEFVFIAVGVGMAMGAVAGYSAGKSRGAEGQDLLGYTLLGGVIGGSAGMIGAGAGAGAAAGFAPGANLAMVGATSGAVGGFAGGSISGMGTSLLNGASFEQSLKNGAISGLFSAGIGAGIGAISGSISQSNRSLFNSEFDELMVGIENEFYYDQLIADANSLGLNYVGQQKSPYLVDFSSHAAYRDVIQSLRYIQANKRFGEPIKNHFDLSTISASDGWKANGQMSFWSKSFNYKNLTFDVNASFAKYSHRLIQEIRTMSLKTYSIGATGVNRGNLIWINVSSRQAWQSLSNYVYKNVPPPFFSPSTSSPINPSQR